MNSKHVLNIAIIEDHNLVRQGVTNALTSINEKLNFIIQSDNGLDFIAQVGQITTVIDIVLVDLEVNNMNGFETITWLRLNLPDVKIIVLTQITDEIRIREALKLGIDGFFEKAVLLCDYPITALLTSIECIVIYNPC